MPGITQGVKLGLGQSLEAQALVPAPLWLRPQKDMLVGGLVLWPGEDWNMFSPLNKTIPGKVLNKLPGQTGKL